MIRCLRVTAALGLMCHALQVGIDRAYRLTQPSTQPADDDDDASTLIPLWSIVPGCPHQSSQNAEQPVPS